MIIFVVLAGSIVLALLRGGKLTNLGDQKVRWSPLILIGLLIQVLIFNSYWQEKIETRSVTPFAYLVSLLLVWTALAVNLHIPGMWLILFGFSLNLIVIALNGGYMPVLASARAVSGHRALAPGEVSNNVIGAEASTSLFFLSDIFAIPQGFLFPNVFSLGDVLIALGAVYLTQKIMLGSPPRGHP